MIWPLALSSLLLLLYLYSIARPTIRRNGQRLRSAPDTLPLLGNAIKFLQPRHLLFDWFVKCQEKFGDETFEISVPSLPPGVVINDPVNLEFVLKNEASITKGDFFKTRSWDLFGYGIINSSGDLWKAQRKAGLKFFSGANLDVMVEEVLPEVYAKTRTSLLQAAKDGIQVDMQKVFLDLTTSVVGQMAYDMDIDSSSPFSQAFDYASDQVGLRFQNPLYPITEFFFGSKLQSSITEVKKFGRQIVSNARKRRGQAAFESLIIDEEPVFGSLIDSLIEAFPNPTIVADSALNFLSAGRDTTAQSMTWMFYSLLRNPHVLIPLRQEIENNFPDLTSVAPPKNPSQPSPDSAEQTTSQPITTASLSTTSTPYLHATFTESLRLHPPVPFELKQTLKQITLPDGTTLPTDAIIVWCIYAMNRSRKTFGPDAHDFVPERWIDYTTTPSTTNTDADAGTNGNGNGNKSKKTKGKLKTKSAWEFPVFNGGPRACLGKRMAELMGVYVFVRILAEFDFEEVLDGGDDDKINEGRGGVDRGSDQKGEKEKDKKRNVKDRRSANSLTLPMDGGLPCFVRLRGLERISTRSGGGGEGGGKRNLVVSVEDE